MSEDAITTQGLTKDYGGGKGLFDLTLSVRAGEVFGYLGPNGAGKTTTIRLLMALMRPTRGSAAIFRSDAIARSVWVKRLVGYLPGELAQFGGLRGDEISTWGGGTASTPAATSRSSGSSSRSCTVRGC